MNKVKEMDLVRWTTIIVIIITVIGYKIKNKDWESNFIKILTKMRKKYILEISNKINFADMDFYYIWMDLIISVTFKMVKRMEMVFFMTLKANVIKDNLKIISSTEKARKFL